MPTVDELESEALKALQARNYRGARLFLSEACAIDGSDWQRWLRLAAANRAEGRLAEARLAAEQSLVRAPRAFPALLMRATLLEKLGDPEAATALAIAVGLAPSDDSLDPHMRGALERARKTHADNIAKQRDALRTRTNLISRSDPGARRAELLIDDALRLRRRFRQEPAQFYYPGLPTYEFYDRALFPWIEELEAATPHIQQELYRLLENKSGLIEPYVNYPEYMPLDQWADLNRNPNWGVFHLIRGGVKLADIADFCPKTLEAARKIPQPYIRERGPNLVFSCLQPHTRIPPHTGISNTRLVVHLPLIVPPNCGFRVGNTTRDWKVGEAFVFDDTLEHEAWNDSDQIRVVLIADIWTPFMSDADRSDARAVMETFDLGTRLGASDL